MSYLALFAIIFNCLAGAPEPRGIVSELSMPRRGIETSTWTLPLARVQREHPSQPFSQSGSVSIGTVTGGYLVRGVQLPLQGGHHRVLTEHSMRGTSFGTDEMIALILAAATAVADSEGGAPLGVGNISALGGGQIPWSYSHHAGRDADLALYLLDEDGQSFFADALVPLGADNTAQIADRQLSLDVGRSWKLIEYLLEQDKARIQHLFLADHITKSLMDEGKRRGASKGVLARLNRLVQQPGKKAPHNDHLHIRLYCTDDDIAEGCVELKSGRPMDHSDHRGRKRNRRKAVRQASSRDPELKINAAWLLGLIGDESSIRTLLKLCKSRNPQLRFRAVQALSRVWKKPDARSLMRIIQKDDSPEIVALVFKMLAKTEGKRLARAAKTLLKRSRDALDPGFREAAIKLSALSESRKTIRRLLKLLKSDNTWADELNRALEMLCCHSVTGRPVHPEDLYGRWTRWFRKNGGSIGRMRQRGLGEAGVKVRRRRKKTARQLVNLILDPRDYLSYNAQRELQQWYPEVGIAIELQNRWTVRRKWKRVVR